MGWAKGQRVREQNGTDPSSAAADGFAVGTTCICSRNVLQSVEQGTGNREQGTGERGGEVDSCFLLSYDLYIQMRYEWDERKNRENQRKHGVDFELASEVFEDERCLIRFDRVDEAGEQRWHAIGAVSVEAGTALILLVAHVYREEDHDGEEIVRIISARRAGKNDVRRYQEEEVD